jgi:tripartite-type tricarboxylate transporter receptor subunit TctC
MKTIVSLVLALFTAAVQAQAWPSKPVRVVVAFAPGGSLDFVTRIVAERLSQDLGQQFVVENRAGANGNVGAEHVARQPADGYSVLASADALVSSAHVYKLGYDPLKDLVPVVQFTRQPLVLAVHPSLGVNSVAELIEAAKKAPGTLSYASSGAGSSTHMSAELFKALSGTDILHIPYKGSGQALPDLMSGRVSMMFENAPGAVGHIRSGKVRALAQTGIKRAASLPELPTVAESGVPGYESLSWSGIAVPAGTPRAVVDRLNKDLNAVLALPDVRQKLAEQGAEAVGGAPEAFAQHILAEREKWSRLIREKNIVVN